MKSIFKSILIISLIICGTSVLSGCLDIDWSEMWKSDFINPKVTTNNATNITENTATLNGTVQANSATQTVSFVYHIGNSSSSLKSVNANPGQVAGTNETKVSADITGLLSGTTYHFTVISEGPSGKMAGNEMSFKTL